MRAKKAAEEVSAQEIKKLSTLSRKLGFPFFIVETGKFKDCNATLTLVEREVAIF